MEMREMSVKIIFEGHEPFAVAVKNGSVKFYRLELMQYDDIDELFEARRVSAVDGIDAE